jgi:hypothetical protein
LTKPVAAGAAVFGLGMFVATEYVIRLQLESGAKLARPDWWGPVAELNFIAILLVAVGGIGWMLLDAIERGVQSWAGEFVSGDD